MGGNVLEVQPRVDPGARLKMKELEARTGVGREAIRFYIREGMLPEPEKPRRNVAYYSEEHVRRLLLIRRLREERELSLARIRQVLDSRDYERIADEPALKGVERLLPTLLDGSVPAEDVPLADLPACCGLDDEDVAAMVAAGLVNPEPRDGVDWVGFREAGIAALWARIRALGFTADRGYDLTLLQRYQDLTRQLAESEVGQFLAAFSADLAPEAAADKAAAALQAANEILAQLHVSAVLDALKRELA